MGKGRHQQDRQYLNPKEYATFYGGFKASAREEGVRRLPFDCCALSQSRFTDAVLAPDGTVYELTQIVPFLRRHKRNPSTGEPLGVRDLVPLRLHRDGEGRLACTVTAKVFTDATRICAIRTTGNVYAWDAVDTLNLQPRALRDLLTDEPFERKDVILLQDPSDPTWLARHDVNAFWYVREKVQVDAGGGSGEHAIESGSGSAAPSVRLSDAARRVLAEVDAADIRGFGGPAAAGAAAADAAAATSVTHVSSFGVVTSGRLAASLTSTGVGVTTRNAAAPVAAVDPREARWAGVRALRKKAYVRLTTSLGTFACAHEWLRVRSFFLGARMPL